MFEKRTVEDLKASHQHWVEMGLKAKFKKRERKWAASIAVGSEEFVSETKRHLGIGRVDTEVEGFCIKRLFSHPPRLNLFSSFPS